MGTGQEKGIALREMLAVLRCPIGTSVRASIVYGTVCLPVPASSAGLGHKPLHDVAKTVIHRMADFVQQSEQPTPVPSCTKSPAVQEDGWRISYIAASTTGTITNPDGRNGDPMLRGDTPQGVADVGFLGAKQGRDRSWSLVHPRDIDVSDVGRADLSQRDHNVHLPSSMKRLADQRLE